MQSITKAIDILQTQTKAKFFVFALPAFCLPLFFSGPQLLTGSIVNLLLIWAARELPRAWALPLAFLPSIGAVLNGVMLWSFSIFLTYMMPAIWAGNILLMYLAKHISHKALALLVGSIAKAARLFLIAYMLVSAHILPSIFLQAMGILQLATALIGGAVIWTIYKVKK